jgi:hypothetical protein
MNNINETNNLSTSGEELLARNYLDILTSALKAGRIKISVEIFDWINKEGKKNTSLSLYFEEFIRPNSTRPLNKEAYRSFVNESSRIVHGENLRRIVSSKPLEFNLEYGINWRKENWTESELSNSISWTKEDLVVKE